VGEVVVGLLVIVGEDVGDEVVGPLVEGEYVGATVVGDKVGDEVVGLRVLVGEEVSPGTRYMKFFNPLRVDAAPFAYIVLQLPEEVSPAFQFPCPKKSAGLVEPST